jgi:hypothetical protein
MVQDSKLLLKEAYSFFSLFWILAELLGWVSGSEESL